MPGVPGAGGLPPKRSTQRRRTNSPPADKVEVTGEVKPPRASKDWHPVARRWFNSLKDSGQSQFYEPSDWAAAFLVAESLSRDLQPQCIGVTEEGEPVMRTVPIKGASMSAYLKAMTSLLVTEGDRRRLRMEVERGAGDSGDAEVREVARLDEFRRRASS